MTSRLRSLRHAKGLTLQGLAAASHSSPTTLVFIERYGHRPGADLRHRIAQALNVDESELWPEVAQAGEQQTGCLRANRP